MLIELENTIKKLEQEVNKQAKVIQWYEKENKHNQEIIAQLDIRFKKIKEYLIQIHNETQHGILSSNDLIWTNIERLCDGKEVLKGR